MYRIRNDCPVDKEKLYTVFTCGILIIGTQILYYHYQDVSQPLIIDYYEEEPEEYFSPLIPENTQSVPNDIYNQLIDIKDFKFKLNPNPCQGYREGLLLVVIISSHPSNNQLRIAIRNTWGQSSDFAKVVFLLGEPSDNATSRDIERESWLYGDIVQGSFVDSYRNMTYKHLMGLKWVAHHCGAARYVLKADDDVVVNSRELWRFLVRELSPWGARKLIFCSGMYKARVVRSGQGSKWMVSVEEMPRDYYPTYCLGVFILYSQDVVRLLLETTQKLPYFWIDDVQITGFAAEKVQLQLTHMSPLLIAGSKVSLLLSQGMNSTHRFLAALVEAYPDTINRVWNRIN